MRRPPTTPGARLWEPRHVDTDLGEDRLRGPFRDPGDGAKVVTGLLERDAGLVGVGREHGVDLGVEAGHGRFKVIDVVQAHPDQQGVVIPEAAAQRPLEVRDLLAELALGHLRGRVRWSV